MLNIVFMQKKIQTRIKYEINKNGNIYISVHDMFLVWYNRKWPKVLPHVKKNPYIINQNHIFSKNYCEVISW